MKYGIFKWNEQTLTGICEWPLFKFPFEREALQRKSKNLHYFCVATDIPVVTER